MLPIKWSYFSISVVGCLILLGVGLSHASNNQSQNGVLAANDVQYRNCYVIRNQNGKLSAQLGESLHGKSSEGIYRLGTTQQKQQCRISSGDTFDHDVPSAKQVLIKFVMPSGKDLPSNFFSGKPNISVYMNVWQMPEGSSNGIQGSGKKVVPSNGKVTMYQYGSTKASALDNEWRLLCSDGTTPCFAENKLSLTAQYDSRYYKVRAYNKSLSTDGKNIITYVSPLLDQYSYVTVNHTLCGNRTGNECKFIIEAIPQPTPTAKPKPTATPKPCSCIPSQACHGYGGNIDTSRKCSTVGTVCCTF